MVPNLSLGWLSKVEKGFFFALQEKKKWILDSGCSRHMSGKILYFLKLKKDAMVQSP